MDASKAQTLVPRQRATSAIPLQNRNAHRQSAVSADFQFNPPKQNESPHFDSSDNGGGGEQQD